MEIGIGLPNSVLNTPGSMITEWARRSEDADFSTLATIDRIAYPSYGSLVSLAAAAAVTKKIGLMTNVLLAPTHSAAQLAKDAVSIDHISGGRLTLGLGVGARRDDYVAAGLPFETRGKFFDSQLATMKKAWAGEPLADDSNPVTAEPVQSGGVRILIGGSPPAAIRRMVDYAAGWTIGGMPPAMAGTVIPEFKNAWKEAGREGEPHVVALCYFAIGGDTNVDALLDYYAFLGDAAQMVAAGAVRTAEQAGAMISEYGEIGVDELIFNPSYPSLDQIDRLADAVF